MVNFFSQKATQPRDRGTLVHGDYKIDNMIFHKSEPRVIGILDWEMATIGHPLSDFCNLTSPYIMDGADSQLAEFRPGVVPGLPTREECVRWYAEMSGYETGKDVAWGDAFFAFRGSVIMQGIAARFAARQASSARAGEYAKRAKPFAEGAWQRVRDVRDGGIKGKL
jgi:aminoglycoside phosphotransferase (APT) family kinase protein